jgi:hypothetical protein
MVACMKIILDLFDFDFHFDSQVFPKDVEKDMVVLMAARASRLENQDAIDAAIVSMLADSKEVVDCKTQNVNAISIGVKMNLLEKLDLKL